MPHRRNLPALRRPAVNQAQRLQRMRERAEEAVDIHLKDLRGCLVLLGRTDDRNPYVARAIIVVDPPQVIGPVIVRFSRVLDSLAMSLSGWVVVRVAPGGRVVGPLATDYEAARRCAASLGVPQVAA